MLNSLLSTGTQKQIIGVSLTPGIGLEACIYDRNKNCVLKHGRKKVEYNFSTREIQNYTEFKTALSSLMEELGASPKAPAYLVLPNVYFDFIEVPTSIADNEIQTAVLSNAEAFYLFKKEEPVSGWCNVVNLSNSSQKRLACTSFQKNAVDSLKGIFEDVGLTLVGIESAYSATVRGLYSVGLLDSTLAKKESWTLMLVNTNSFTLMYFDADNLTECNEVPIAIKSFSAEEAYAAIASSASQLLDNFSSSKLYIISQTDDVCAEVLKQQMMYDKEIITVDSNKYSNKPVVDVLQSSDFNWAKYLTLGAIGASNVKTDFSLHINVLADDPSSNLGVYCTTSILGTMVDITQEFIMKVCILVAAVCVAFFGIIALLLMAFSNNTASRIEELSSEISNVDSMIAAESTQEVKQEINIDQIIDEVAQINVKTIKFYDSIANDMPKNIWLTKYYNVQGDKIAITGIAESITDIYEYFKNLKIGSPESDIKLEELKVITGNEKMPELKGLSINSAKDRLYSFEISNTAMGDFSQAVSEDSDGERDSKNTEGDIIIKAAGGGGGNSDGYEEVGNVENMSDQVKPLN